MRRPCRALRRGDGPRRRRPALACRYPPGRPGARPPARGPPPPRAPAAPPPPRGRPPRRRSCAASEPPLGLGDDALAHPLDGPGRVEDAEASGLRDGERQEALADALVEGERLPLEAVARPGAPAPAPEPGGHRAVEQEGEVRPHPAARARIERAHRLQLEAAR